MKTLTARGYMVSRLTDVQVHALHSAELEAGYCFSPFQIRNRFNLPEVGDVSQESYWKSETVVTAIYEKARAYYRDRHRGCCFALEDGTFSRPDSSCPDNPDLAVAHATDKKIRDEDVPFPMDKIGGRLRSEIGV